MIARLASKVKQEEGKSATEKLEGTDGGSEALPMIKVTRTPIKKKSDNTEPASLRSEEVVESEQVVDTQVEQGTDHGFPGRAFPSWLGSTLIEKPTMMRDENQAAGAIGGGQNPPVGLIVEGNAGTQVVPQVLAERLNSGTRMKYALELIPEFDGKNITLQAFRNGCEEAKGLLTPADEIELARYIKLKLKGEVRDVIVGKNFNSISEVIDYLKTVFPSTKTHSQLYAELGNSIQGRGESVLSYANRVKQIGLQIIEVQKAGGGVLVTPEFIRSINSEIEKCFVRGLKAEIRNGLLGRWNEGEAMTKALEVECEVSAIRSLNALNQTICQLCKKIGHSADECRSRITNVTAMICQLRNKPGHAASLCRSRENTVVTSTCQLCGKVGHTAAACRSGTSQLNPRPNEILICNYCNKRGHSADQCYSKQALCYICNTHGHFVRDCPKAQSSSQQRPNEKCQLCEKIGHTAKQCGSSSIGNGGISCSLCGKTNHTADKCFRAVQPKPVNVAKSRPFCTYCNKLGHNYEQCYLLQNINRKLTNEQNLTESTEQGNGRNCPTVGVSGQASVQEHPLLIPTYQTNRNVE